MRARRSGAGGAGACLRPGQGLRRSPMPRMPRSRRRRAPPSLGMVMVPDTPRAVTAGAGRGDPPTPPPAPRSSACSATRSPMAVADRGPRARPPRGPAARRARTRPMSAALRALLPEATEIWAAARRRRRGARAAARRRPHLVRLDRSAAGRAGPASPSTGRGSRARELGRAHPRRRPQPGNAAAAARLGAYALDVCSGVEAAPGRKDPARLAGLFRGAAAAGQGRSGRSRHADARPLRRLWRRLCAGNIDAGARAAGGAPSSTRRRIRPSRPSSPIC